MNSSQQPNLGQKIAATGWAITKLVYGTLFLIILLVIVWAIVSSAW